MTQDKIKPYRFFGFNRGMEMVSYPRPKGIYQKYCVKRIDGKHDDKDTKYIVLKIAKGRIAEQSAIRAYAEAVRDKYPEFSSDLMGIAREMEPDQPERGE